MPALGQVRIFFLDSFGQFLNIQPQLLDHSALRGLGPGDVFIVQGVVYAGLGQLHGRYGCPDLLVKLLEFGKESSMGGVGVPVSRLKEDV